MNGLFLKHRLVTWQSKRKLPYQMNQKRDITKFDKTNGVCLHALALYYLANLAAPFMCLTFHYHHYGHPAACKLESGYHPPPHQMHLISLSSRRIHSSTIHPSGQDQPRKRHSRHCGYQITELLIHHHLSRYPSHLSVRLERRRKINLSQPSILFHISIHPCIQPTLMLLLL